MGGTIGGKGAMGPNNLGKAPRPHYEARKPRFGPRYFFHGTAYGYIHSTDAINVMTLLFLKSNNHMKRSFYLFNVLLIKVLAN